MKFHNGNWLHIQSNTHNYMHNYKLTEISLNSHSNFLLDYFTRIRFARPCIAPNFNARSISCYHLRIFPLLSLPTHSNGTNRDPDHETELSALIRGPAKCVCECTKNCTHNLNNNGVGFFRPSPFALRVITAFRQ